MSPKYDNKYNCNKCGETYVNTIKVTDYINNIMCECETTCINCGFKDYWAYGFFESRSDGFNETGRYSRGELKNDY